MANDRTLASATLIFLVGFGSSVMAEDQPAPVVDEVTQLKKRLDALEKEITTLQSEVQQSGQPGPAAGTNASSSPASSLDARVWKLEADGQTDNGFSFGGVGDVTLSMQKGQGYTATGDFNPIFLYSYKDALLFVAELNADQNGVSLGQAWVAYTALEHVIVEGGYFPIPFGVYSERLSPTWINKFSNLAPSPYNEDYGVFSGDQTIDGAQVRGDLALADNTKINYHVFISAPPVYNGPDNADPDNRLSFGGVNTTHVPPTIGARIGVLPMPTSEIGLSAMAGHIINNQTVDPTIDDNQSRTFAAVAVDGEYHYKQAVLRGEYVRLNYQDPSGARQHSQGAYLQASHHLTDIAGWVGGFEPVLRMGRVQRSLGDNGFQDVSELGIGMNYYLTTFIRTSLLAMATNVHTENQVSFNTTFTY